ncbi:MAG TPA: dihydroorotase [Propionibacteriaceae bacterium]|nr:dihydroorotase [Propionibacteriaceae bacterium]
MTVLVGLDVVGRGVRDLAIRDGVIVEPDGTETVLDCRGLVALPALVDPHTHLRDPGPGTAETIESGSRAAARGGYGAVCAMPNTVPVADTAEICAYERQRGAEVGLVDVVPIGAVTLGEEGAQLADIAGMGAVGVRMFSDDGKCVARSDVMRDALVEIGKLGGVLAQHAQDPLLTIGAQVDAGVADQVGLPGWPTMAESAIVARDVIMAAELGCRLHACHVSTAQTVAVVRWAKAQGYPVTAEVTPHHLMLDSSTALSGDAAYKVNPPLRSAADVQALRDAFVDGTIDVVGTDHAPHAPETKRGDWCEASMGMLGLETALAVVADLFVRTGRLAWADIAERMSYAPARLAGLEGHGLPLEVGAPANLCLVDPHRTWRSYGRDLASIAENTPYEGLELSTRVVATLLRGRVTYDLDGRFA